MNRDSNRVIVCGGRDYDDTQTVIGALYGLPVGTIIVHGGCVGADQLAAGIWRSWKGTVEPHSPDTKKHGSPAAFHIRNQEMVDAGARYVIAFPGGAGTADCIRRAEAAGIQVKKVGKKAKKES